MPTPSTIVQVALHTPSHSGVGDLLSYASEHPLAPGTLVRVPLGRRETLGVVWDGAPADAATLDLDLAGLCHATLHLIGPDEAILPAANNGLTIILGREGGDVLDLCGLSQDLPMDI